MAPATVKPAGLKKGGKWPLPAPMIQEKVQYLPVPPAHTLKLVSVSRLFSNCYLCAGIQKWCSLGFYSSLALSDLSPTGVQSQMLWEFLFLVQIPQARASTPRSLGTASVVL